MKTWIYSWIIYPIGLTIAHGLGFFRPKIRRTLRLRSWKNHLSLRLHAQTPIEYWIHVASAGELEYALPILNELNRIQKKVLITYYSVSAQKVVETLPQKYPCVALTVPLPHDGLGLMAEFVKLVRIQGVEKLLLLKYEMWPGLLWECNAHDVKVILTEALRPSWLHKRLLHKLTALLFGYESELIGVQHPACRVVGDTRVERVAERVAATEPHIVERFRSLVRPERSLLVCGSIWPKDQQMLQSALQLECSNVKSGALPSLPDIIWLPHELDRRPAQEAELDFRKLGYDTLWVEKESDLAHVRLSDRPAAFIVFKKGVLVEIYKLAYRAFVGGGFVREVHSVWEPAMVGCYVACGPGIARSPESHQLAAIGVLRVVNHAEDFRSWLKETSLVQKKVSELPKFKPIVESHRGAAQRIIQYCEERTWEKTNL